MAGYHYLMPLASKLTSVEKNIRRHKRKEPLAVARDSE
jgi:hypothetical protein